MRNRYGVKDGAKPAKSGDRLSALYLGFSAARLAMISMDPEGTRSLCPLGTLLAVGYKPAALRSTRCSPTSARNKVVEQVGRKGKDHARLPCERVDCRSDWCGPEVQTDREYPPFDRSTRDGRDALSKEAAPGAQLKGVGEIKIRRHVSEGST